jgi:uncharacterized delta-60 repeat protein
VTVAPLDLSSAGEVAVAADGSVFLGGSIPTGSPTSLSFRETVLKLKPDGTPDGSFGDGGFVYDALTPAGGFDGSLLDIAVDGNGNVLVAGRSSDAPTMARLNGQTGAPDNTFSGDGRLAFSTRSGTLQAIALASDGTITVAGVERATGTDRTGFDFYVHRLEPDGDPDPSWSGGGPTVIDFFQGADAAFGLALAADGRATVTGPVESGADDSFASGAIVRLTSSGALDTNFSGDGKIFAGFNDVRRTAADVAVQADGKTIVAGTIRHARPQSPTGITDDFFLTRYNVDGRPTVRSATAARSRSTSSATSSTRSATS